MSGRTDIAALMEKVGRIRVLTNHLIDDELSGNYHSTFKGQGVEFDEVRPYEVGDDVRSIDWNVTARTGMPYIKRYSEERELTILFAVDVSGSLGYGSRGRTKAELAAEVTALLALTAIRNQDKVGLLLFSDRIVKYIPPRKGRDSVMRLAREVLAAGEGAEGGTDVAGALKFLNGVRKRKAVVFLVSDFMVPQTASVDEVERLVKATARRHDVICVTVADPAESALPNAGLVELEDPETGEIVLADTSSASVRKAFAAAAEEEAAKRAGFFRRSGIDVLSLATDRPYIDDIRALFKRRARRRG
ncbi:MAG: DUF58 domain-containing protein [Kiritimatiellae bacterium]|nr:DUF58 domain-containing protein [Kiritimatiellia bacterium]